MTTTLICPHCQAKHPDEWECAEFDRPTAMRCSECRQEFTFYLRECPVCVEESVFTWESTPPMHLLAILVCQFCGEAFHASNDESDGARPFCEFSQLLGKQALRFRVYREPVGFLCERELVESDGSGFTQALPFQAFEDVQAFLVSDPYYPAIRRAVNRLLDRLALELAHELTSSDQ